MKIANLAPPHSQPFKPIRTIAEAEEAVAGARDRLDLHVADYQSAVRQKKLAFGGLVGGMGVGIGAGLLLKSVSPALALGVAAAGTVGAMASAWVMVSADMRATERAIEFPFRKSEVKLYEDLLKTVEKQVEDKLAKDAAARAEMAKLASFGQNDSKKHLETDIGYLVVNGTLVPIQD
ncbi:MAG: hypothetical protein KC910_00590 [Candidatus Eremiobacteraeota bacterium]|nr:hypothetical protein [Candidatus Eremiobacteraeota bacterium]